VAVEFGLQLSCVHIGIGADLGSSHVGTLVNEVLARRPDGSASRARGGLAPVETLVRAPGRPL